MSQQWIPKKFEEAYKREVDADIMHGGNVCVTRDNC